MLKLIKNEIKKIIISRKYIVAMIVLLALYIGVTCLVYRDTINSTPEARLNNNKQYIEYLNKQKENKNIDEKRKKEIELKLNELETINKSLEFEKDSKNMDWKEKLKGQNKVLERQIKSLNSKEPTKELADYTQSIKLNEYYLKNDINPIESYKVNSFNIVSKINAFFSMLIVALIISIITSDSISGEFTPATIKLLLTKPISREKVLFCKFLASIIVCGVSFILLKFVMFLTIGFTFSFGNYKEPIAFYANYLADEDLIAKLGFGVKADIDSLKIYSSLKFILLSEAFSLLFITTCVSINLLISTITQKTSSSIGISVLLFATTSILTNSQLNEDIGKNPIIHSISPYLFSTYSSGELVLGGHVMKNLGINFANTCFAILILSVWTIVCYLIANFIFVKKDIII